MSHATPTADHPAHVAHHFESAEQQTASAKLGMWVFLATELLMFGGLFCAYTIYRANHPEVFYYASQFLDTTLGGINTAVLISSSFTMAWAVRATQLGQRRAAALCLALTILGGLGFMGIKAVEYRHKWVEGLKWGQYYNPKHAGPPTTRAAAPAPPPPPALDAAGRPLPPADFRTALAQPGAAPQGLSHEKGLEAIHGRHHLPEPRGVAIFFSVYFMMTGLHAIHVLVGLGLIGWILTRTLRGEFSPAYNIPVDLVGLYWHLVDLIWIFLFPLLYLIH